MKRKFFSVIFTAAVLTVASMGITASAEENTEFLVSENADETVSGALDESSAEDVPIDYFSDDYYDTNGNATLIQEENIIYNSEEMQFIAVTTKDGHVFYVLINYSAENGEDNVYFLNKVDDYDLYALLYAGEEDEDGNTEITPEQAAQAAENANSRIKPQNDSEKANETTDSSGNEEQSAEKTPAKSSSMNMSFIYLVIGVIAIAAVGFAGFKFLKKPKKSTVQTDEEEEINFYDDDEINEDEE